MSTKVNNLTIYFNGGALKFDPSMLIQDTKGREVFFNPVIKYNPRVVYYIPTGQNKKYRYNKFFSATSFNDQIISETIRSLGGRQMPLTLEEAKRTGVTDFNINTTLHALFATDSILYINKKPYTIFSYSWNKEWQIDTKISNSLVANPYASDAFARYSRMKEDEARKELNELSPDVLMSSAMEENIQKTVDKGIKTPPSIKNAAGQATSQGSKSVRKNPITASNKSTYPPCLKKLVDDKKTQIAIAYAYNPNFSKRSHNYDPISLTFTVPSSATPETMFDSKTVNKPALIETYDKLCDKSEKLTRLLNYNNEFINNAASGITRALPIYEELLKNITAAKTANPAISRVDCAYNVETASIYAWINDPKNNSALDKYKSSLNETPVNEFIEELKKESNVIVSLAAKHVKNQPPLTQDEIETYSKSLLKASSSIEALRDIAPEAVTEINKMYKERARLTCKDASMLSNDKETQAIKIMKDVNSTTLIKNINEILILFLKTMDECVKNVETFFDELVKYYSLISELLDALKLNYSETDAEYGIISDDLTCYKELAEFTKTTFVEYSAKIDKLKLDAHYLRINISAVTDTYGNSNEVIKYYNDPGLIKVDSLYLCSYIVSMKMLFEMVSELFLGKLSNCANQIATVNKSKFNDSFALYDKNLTAYNAFDDDKRTAYEASLKIDPLSAPPITAATLLTHDPKLISAYEKLHDATLIGNVKKYISAHVYLTNICCQFRLANAQSSYNMFIYKSVFEEIATDLNKMNSAVKLLEKSIHYEINSGLIFPIVTVDTTTTTLNNLKKTCAKQFKDVSKMMSGSLQETCAKMISASASASGPTAPTAPAVVPNFSDKIVQHGYEKNDDAAVEVNGFFEEPKWTVYDPSNKSKTLLSVICDILNIQLDSNNEISGHELSEEGVFLQSIIAKMDPSLNGVEIDFNDDNLLLETLTYALKIRFLLFEIVPQENGSKQMVFANCAKDYKLYPLGEEEDDENIKKYKTINKFVIILKRKGPDGVSNYSILHSELFKKCVIDVADIKASALLGIIGLNCKQLDNEVDVLKTALTVKKGGAVTGDMVTEPPTVPTSTVPIPSIKSKNNRILENAKMESKLSYYIMVDLVLSPGDKINPIQKLGMGCKMQMDKILKSMNETFGYAYTPPPLFTDYEVNRHDKDSTKFVATQQFETPYDENLARKLQREREIDALISENQRGQQELAVNRALLNDAQTRRRSLF